MVIDVSATFAESTTSAHEPRLVDTWTWYAVAAAVVFHRRGVLSGTLTVPFAGKTSVAVAGVPVENERAPDQSPVPPAVLARTRQ